MRKNLLNLTFNFHAPRFEITKIDSEIHSKRESENSQRNFGFERTRKVDSRVISKIFKRKSWQK
jgi:hypothetical protein